MLAMDIKELLKQRDAADAEHWPDGRCEISDLIVDVLLDALGDDLLCNIAAGPDRVVVLPKDRPEIICLCGSTRFTDVMLAVQWELTKKGRIVLSWCALPDGYFQDGDMAHAGDKEGVREIVDEVHKRKIDLCDRVFVINVGGYIGESTRSEIDYAVSHNKPVGYLEAAEAAQKGAE